MFASLVLPYSNKLFINRYLKLSCLDIVDYVSMKVFKINSAFENELNTEQYVQSSQRVASYYDSRNKSLNVAVHHHRKNVTLYHSADENKNLEIPCNGTKVNVMKRPGDDFSYQKFYCFIFYFQ